MTADWQRLPLREAGVSVIDCEHRTPRSVPTGYPYVTIPELRDGRINVISARRISDRDFRDWTRRARPRAFDVVLSRRTNPGTTAFVSDGIDFALGQNLVLLRSDGSRIHPAYLRWLVRSPDWWGQVQRHLNVGAVFDSLRVADIPNFELPIPSHAEQRAIADILGSLDDKVELNDAICETLEAMARALFKSWFVEFDPVRAMAEGRDPGLPQQIAELFPHRFEESEFGRFPMGWRISTLGDETVTLLGGTPARAEPAYWGGDIPWINSSKAHELRVIQPSEWITFEGLESSATKLLPARTTIIAITGATLGQVSLTEIDTCANQSLVGVLESDSLPSEFIYLWVRERISDLIAWQTGGAQQHINKNNVNALPVICPSGDVMAAFKDVARPMFDRIKMALLERLALAEARDLLLPKLTSGEIRVPHAERVLEAAQV